MKRLYAGQTGLLQVRPLLTQHPLASAAHFSLSAAVAVEPVIDGDKKRWFVHQIASLSFFTGMVQLRMSPDTCDKSLSPLCP